jgi:KDO2-lipid IV(A) lauroyltransferase
VSRIVFAFMWVVHFLPLAGMARVGNTVGNLLFWLIPERRKVTRINLQKCFPAKSAAEREALARAHFRAFTRAFIEQGILWWSPPERISSLV